MRISLAILVALVGAMVPLLVHAIPDGNPDVSSTRTATTTNGVSVSVVAVRVARIARDVNGAIRHPFVPRHDLTEVDLWIQSEASLLSIDGECHGPFTLGDGTGAEQAADVFGFPHVDDDGHSLLVPLKLDAVPNRSTRLLRVRGIACAMVADQRAEATANLRLRVGFEFEIAGVQFRVSDVYFAGPSTTRVEFTSHGEAQRIERFAFARCGRAIRATRTDWSQSRTEDETTRTVTYELAGRPSAVEITATYFTDVREFDVPVDLVFGVGLGP